MLKQVKRYCEEHELLGKDDTVVVACSGGPDSMAMLDMLLQLRGEMGFALAVAHFEHGIRGQESLDDAEYVKEYCQERNVEFYMKSADVPEWAKTNGKSLETAARELRYQFLQKVSQHLGGALIATAHHRDDQAETVLMHILRGSGLTGLSGIRPKRDNIIRPVLFLSKEQLLDYCYANRIQARMDRTNEVADCTRNRIRLNLMPSLASSYNQAITEGLCHLAEIASLDGDYLRQETIRAYDEMVQEKDGRLKMRRDEFQQLHQSIRRRLLQMIIRRAAGCENWNKAQAIGISASSMSNLGYVHVRLLADFIENGKTGTRVSLPGDVQAVMDYGTLSVYKKAAEAVRIFSEQPVKLNVPGATVTPALQNTIMAEVYERGLPPELETEIKGNNLNIAVIDMEKCHGELVVRFRKEGDRLSLTSGTKKLKDFFIDQKLPREQRMTVPLVCDDDGILWAVGHKRTILAAADKATNKFLVLRYYERGL